MTGRFVRRAHWGFSVRIPGIVAILLRELEKDGREEALRLLRAYWGSFAED